MEQSEELPHQCPGCAAGAADPARRGWSRRSVLQLGLAAGMGAAAARVSPAFAEIAGHAPGALVAPPGAHAGVVADLPQQPKWPVPAIVTRAQWGANEAARKPGQSYNTFVDKIVVHHTVTPNNPPDPAAIMRGVYAYSLANGYIDIAYHFLIDQNGRIYEGRWAQDYPAGVPHSGENALHESVQGAATLGHNPNTIAVALLGTFTDILPTPQALSALVTVLTWKCARWGIDPHGSTPYRNSDGGIEVFPDIIGHRQVTPTICPGDPLMARLATIRDQVDTRLRNGVFGYWIAGVAGWTRAYGDVPDVGDLQSMGLPAAIQGIAGHPNGLGYWSLGADGGVFTFGEARFFGSMGGRFLNRPVVGMAPTRTGNGYWLVATDGGIFSFGDARFFGSTGAIHLNQPIVGMAATPSGNGYWLVARDGGVFSFGDARFFGSTGAIHLNQPIVAMAPAPSGNGYWLLARDGGMFCFGAARYFGSGPQRGLRVPAVDLVATTSGNGYAILAADGTVLSFGDAPNYGSATGAGPVAGFAGRLQPLG